MSPVLAERALRHHTGVYVLRGDIRKRGRALRVLQEVASTCSLTPVKSVTHVFPARPYPAISALMVLRESHIGIHTYPERDEVLLTLSVCRPVDEEALRETLRQRGLQLVKEPSWLRV